MITWYESTVRLLLAMFVAALIGWEREYRGKPAGFRTHILVALGSAVFVLAGTSTALLFDEPVDAVRAVVGVMQGIGFLGAGIILQTRGEVFWLTTAASLWVTAGIGATFGLGHYYLGLVAGLLAIITLSWLDRLEGALLRRLPPRGKPKVRPKERERDRSKERDRK